MPPKPKRTDLTSQPFLFVNEDANTVNRLEKDPELDRTKQSHVQRQNLAKKRRLREQTVSAAGGTVGHAGDIGIVFTSRDPSPGSYFPVSPQNLSNAVEFGSLGSPGEGDFGLLQHQSSSSTSQPSTPSTRPILSRTLPLTNPDPQFDLIFRPDLYRIPPGSSASSPSAVPWLTASYSQDRGQSRSPSLQDPLNNVELALNWWAPPLIQYHTRVILPGIYANELRYVPLSHMRHAAAIHADMQACMSDPAHMYALCAVTSMHMLYKEDGLLLPHTNWEMHARIPLLFKTWATEALRTKLQSRRVDAYVVVDVMRLMTAAMVNKNPLAIEAHSSALTRMISFLGGLETFEPYVQERVILAELYSGGMEGGKLHLPLSWDVGPLSQEAMGRIGFQGQVVQYPPGSKLMEFARLALRDVLVVQAISDLILVRQVVEYASVNHSYDAEVFRWIFLRKTAVTHRLLQAQFKEKETVEEDWNPVVSAIRTTLILWSGLEQADQVGRAPLIYQSSLLRAQLEETRLASMWRPHTNALLWISIIGGLSAYNDLLPTPQNENWQWFARLAAQSSYEAGVLNSSHLKNVLREFLYDDDCRKEILNYLEQDMWEFREGFETGLQSLDREFLTLPEVEDKV